MSCGVGSFAAGAMAEPAWHALGGQAVLDAQGSRSAGLSGAEAAARLDRHGPNLIAPAQPERAVTVLWRQLSSPLILVLIGAGALALALGELTDGAVVLAVVVANSAIGFGNGAPVGRSRPLPRSSRSARP